jgi:hypothetical protein
MDLTKQDLATLKILVEKELETIKKEGEQLIIVNSPFLNKVSSDDSDLEFLKSEVKYQQFLEELLKKL